MGPGRALQLFRRSRSQELTDGPKNTLGLKQGLKGARSGYPNAAALHRWWLWATFGIKVTLLASAALPRLP